MANKKISDLAAATTPLSGAEKLELEGSDGNSGRCTTQDVADLAKATLSVQTVISAGTVTPVASNDKVVISA